MIFNLVLAFLSLYVLIYFKALISILNDGTFLPHLIVIESMNFNALFHTTT